MCVEDNPEAQQLRVEIVGLKESLRSLDYSTQQARQAVETSATVLEKHQTIKDIVKPWLEKAQITASAGMSKPMNLDEAEKQLRSALQFQQECACQNEHLKGRKLF